MKFLAFIQCDDFLQKFHQLLLAILIYKQVSELKHPHDCLKYKVNVKQHS